MSEFDEEAERERLREQYERDQQKREVTEKMSELLLQGATMTNAHCQDCGDPIFRYDGQEFCASCEKPVDRGTGDDEAAEGDGSDADGDEPEAAEDGERIEVAAPDDSARVQFGGDGEDAGAEPETPQPGSPRERARQPDATREPTPPASEPTASGDTDLAQSRAELHRRLQDLSRRAGATEDPREAEAHLAAAREAAEALAALRR